MIEKADEPTVRTGLSDGAWHRVHPLTPVLKSGAIIAALLGIGVSKAEESLRNAFDKAVGQGDSSTSSGSHGGSWLVAGALLAALLAVLLLANWLAWRKTEFLIDDDSIHTRKGLIAKQQSKARLDRVQAIDLEQPLVARMFGLARVKFDVAGGRHANLAVEYLRRQDAEALREAMLARVRVSRETHSAVTAAAGLAGAQGETELGSARPAAGVDGWAGARTADQLAADGNTGGGEPLSDHAGGGSSGESVRGAHNGFGSPSTSASSPEVARQLTDAAHRPGASLGSRIVHGTIPGVFDDLSTTLTEALAPYRVTVNAAADGRIVWVPPHRVLLAQLMTAGPLFGALVLVCVIVLLVYGVATGHASEAASVAFTLSFMVFGAVHAALRAFLNDANFSVALTRDGIVVTHGLTSTTRRVIPVDRIQAVELRQPVLWRRFGWWRVRMNLAGGGAGGDDVGTLLLPVGSIDDALVLLGLVLPEPGTPDGVTGRDLMIEAMTARATSDESAAAALFSGPGARARVVDPLTARREAWARTTTMLVIRAGRLTRRAVCVPHARVQSMAVTQGPLERRLGLSTVELHSTHGPVKPKLPHLDAGAAQRFLLDHADVTCRARAALDGRWAQASSWGVTCTGR